MCRFTIRDMLWLTAVVALAVGWWLNHSSHQAKAIEAAKIHHEDLRQLTGEIAALKENNAALEQHVTARDSN